ncbi:hypothetical protein GPECTOR_1g103 [Gonium pectorale]|uniref:Amine oxidase domain-containing protein n=1 Tax=Gonium pectorale TaxID=33097 RepID=A0A150H282_GONPE|nr:hypothetical protein GPECTOR_1g103 [Gonium pectorale]|eukprot:KXZ56123.1 hypothetical protein GPECTOR_1g103 [Gonium pectorale]
MCTRTVTLGTKGEKVTFDHDNAKAMWVGHPTNSAVGRALAARAGPRLRTLTGHRVEALQWDRGSGKWSCRLKQTAPTSGAGSGADTIATAWYDYVVTALSSVSTVRLLGDSGADGPLAPDVVAAASEVRANVCWALMVALNKRIDVPFDGALLSRPAPASGEQQYGAIAWVSRDSSKPGRPAVAGGRGEAWVVHAGPRWSNERRDMAPAAVAQELLRDFAHLVQVPLSASDVIHMEAHRWNNAYPLNPRQPQAPPQQAQDSGLALGGHFLLRPEMRLGACGDWCKGPRAADAYVTGWEAAHALLQL